MLIFAFGWGDKQQLAAFNVHVHRMGGLVGEGRSRTRRPGMFYKRLFRTSTSAKSTTVPVAISCPC